MVVAFRKPSVTLKSNTGTPFKNYLNFPASSPAYGTFYRITGGFLNANVNSAAAFGKISKISVLIEASRNLKNYFS
jgi:hypothetical protein